MHNTHNDLPKEIRAEVAVITSEWEQAVAVVRLHQRAQYSSTRLMEHVRACTGVLR
jgi:hypothetical protein